LASRNFIKANSIEDADIFLFLSYGVGEPESYQQARSVPIYGFKTIPPSKAHRTIISSGQYGHTPRTGRRGPPPPSFIDREETNTFYSSQYGVTGYRTEIDTYTRYTRFIVLEAYTQNQFKDKTNQIWRTKVTSTGKSQDLRAIFPYMLIVMKPYIAESTGHAIDIDISEGSPAALQITQSLL